MEIQTIMINSVLKAIKIMHLFNKTETRHTLAEISRRLEIPKSTAHNLLNTLLSEGYIEKVEGDAYALGTTPLVLTQNIRANVEIRDPAAPLLRQLADYARESVYLTIRDGDYALYIYAVESPQRLLARTAVGDQAPLHCTAVGKATLAFLPEEEVEAIMDRVGMAVFTEKTISSLDALKEDLAKTRKRGYSIDCEEHEANTFCIGAPILDRRGRVIGACSLSGTSPDIITDRLEDLSTHVMHASQEISRRMGYVPVSSSLVSTPGR
jgi:DNA-binding IclR family transcriptional regulator